MTAHPPGPSVLPAASAEATHTFRLSPLIRLTLLLLYGALTLPLPVLAAVTDAPVPAWGLAIAILLGAGALLGALSQQVVVDAAGIAVTYPRGLRWLLRGGWRLDWSQIRALKPRSTGQGGLVYYFVDEAAERAYLLPMRVAGFARLVGIVEARTGIDTRDLRPLAQPWMYGFLLILSLLLLGVDGWVLATAAQMGDALPAGPF